MKHNSQVYKETVPGHLMVRSGRDNTLPLEGIEQISCRRPEFGMAKTFASSVPVHNLPVGKKGEKDSGGNLESIGTYRGFSRG